MRRMMRVSASLPPKSAPLAAPFATLSPAFFSKVSFKAMSFSQVGGDF